MISKKLIALGLTAGMTLSPVLVRAEEAVQTETSVQAEEENVENTEAATKEQDAAMLAVADQQKLDASYTLALNAINAEDYQTAKEYLSICFVYCDPQTNPTMYADLLLKRACIDVIEEHNDMALLMLDAALRIQPELADAYLVRTQINADEGNIDEAIADLEKYIELSNRSFGLEMKK